MTKKCGRCCEEKSSIFFHKNKRRPDGLQLYCKDCRANIDKKSYISCDKQKRQARNLALSERNRRFVEDYKRQKSCRRCSMSDFRALEFHHPENNKKFDVASITHRAYSLQTIKDEIDKCECLCVNCHRIVTCESRNV